MSTRNALAAHRQKRVNLQSSYIGVSVVKMKGGIKYRARFTSYKRLIHLGLFNTPEEAARARDQEAVKRFGRDAVLNFPES